MLSRWSKHRNQETDKDVIVKEDTFGDKIP